jgi:hypothetical protein
MSHSFDIHGGDPPAQSRDDLIKAYWWAGDNLANTRGFDYDGLNVPNKDEQDNPTHGSCTSVGAQGELLGYVIPPCTTANSLYIEPASGFWIVNPATTLRGNSIGGCQGIGVGYWYVAPADAAVTALKFSPVGPFVNNRVHGCYSGVYNEAFSSIASTGQFHPHADGTRSGQPIIATLDGITATRNRSRGIWLRPTWIVVKNARLATNRENVTLVSSGGSDGNAPGVWQLLTQSVVVGMSQNNVDRFGPCFTAVGDVVGNPSSGKFGCIDQTRNSGRQQGGDDTGRGYPDPTRNAFGYMLYDGPVLVFDTRFVNFNVDIRPHLTTKEAKMFDSFLVGKVIPSQPPSSNALVYEGDAAFGWFQANQSSYPTATSSRGLIFEHTDLIHQIYTQDVNIDKFQDGDKNTAILDLDGTLTGYKVVDQDGIDVPGAFPVSLNNLPFHHDGPSQGGSVDECHALGAQNRDYEGRPTSLISPGSVGTLEFSALWPLLEPADRAQANSHWQVLTFTRDALEFTGTASQQHPSQALTSRNGLGVWEPKVTSGHGYTVGASVLNPIPPPYCVCGSGPPCPDSPGTADLPNPLACVMGPPGSGIPPVLNVGVADVVKPDIDTHPFVVRLGICYTSTGGSHPKFPAQKDQLFTITRGYKSYGQLDGNERDTQLQLYWNKLRERYQDQSGLQNCHNLDDLERQTPTSPSRNLDPVTGCPANGITAVPEKGCAPPSVKMTWKDLNSPSGESTGCVFPKQTLSRVDDISKLTTDTYFYDEALGLLYLYVAQGEPNASGPSPLGSCRGGANDDASCPFKNHGESYYSCPAQGCWVYMVRLNDPSYRPIASNCAPYETYAQDSPPQTSFLADKSTTPGTKAERVFGTGVGNKFPHYQPSQEPAFCSK